MQSTSRSIVCSLAVTIFASFSNVRATDVIGLKLEIGAGNDAVNWSAAIGLANIVDGTGSFALGEANEVSGFYNSAFGYSNFSNGSSSLVIGGYNQLHKTASSRVDMVLAVGINNIVESGVSGSVVCGYDNFVGITGGTAPETVTSTATFGIGLKNKWNLATVLGKYNSITPPTSLIFAIGNGSADNNRSNAMEVYTDGKVIIRKAQGDILMGEFGN